MAKTHVPSTLSAFEIGLLARAVDECHFLGVNPERVMPGIETLMREAVLLRDALRWNQLDPAAWATFMGELVSEVFCGR